MYNYYLDHTDYYHTSSSKPDTIIMAGLIIDEENKRYLQGIFKGCLNKYNVNINSPIKWNFKNLKKEYKSKGQSSHYHLLLDEMENFRKDIFTFTSHVDYKIIFTCNKIWCNDKQNYDVAKTEAIKYSFSNSLMRLGLEARRKRIECKIISDWPCGNDKQPFEEEYESAFNKGKSTSGINYFCGPLNEIGFDSSMYFTTTKSSIELQFVDILLGSFSASFKHYKKAKYSKTKIEYCKIYFDKILNANQYRFLPHGISVSSRDNLLKSDMRKFVQIIDPNQNRKEKVITL